MQVKPLKSALKQSPFSTIFMNNDSHNKFEPLFEDLRKHLVYKLSLLDELEEKHQA